jgi:GDP-D-mannose dehydratase
MVISGVRLAKTVLITGVTGQDGSYLSEFLLEKGYDVNGIERRASLFNTERVDQIYQYPHVPDGHFTLYYGDLDTSAVQRFFRDNRPEQVYIAAARVGGISANNMRKVDAHEFARDHGPSALAELAS